MKVAAFTTIGGVDPPMVSVPPENPLLSSRLLVPIVRRSGNTNNPWPILIGRRDSSVP